MEAKTVLDFWFVAHGSDDWFKADPAFDRLIARRFALLHHQASAGELFSWRDSADGRLAEIIVLDQFSRNIHRGAARAFAADGMALALAQEAVRAGADRQLAVGRRRFVYMPYMHSESLVIHDEGRRLFATLGDAETLTHADRHREIIARFGRYPHRNPILGRESTPAEIAYLGEENRYL